MDDLTLVRRTMERWIELVAARDIEGLEAFVTMSFAPEVAGAQEIVAQARDAFEDWDAEQVEFTYELLEVVEAPRGILASAAGRGRIQGYEVATHFTYLFEVRDGQIVSMSLSD